TGMGLGIVGARRLMDRFFIETTPGRGTEVVFTKELPDSAPAAAKPSQIAEQLARTPLPAAEEEVRQADRELLRAIGELRALNEGQRKALELMRRSALDLTEMVNDLLDLSKIEAGKITVRPTDFDVAQLFRSLRGVLRPLLQDGSSVQLIFDPPPDLPPLFTDEAKVTQIVRNFASNALKFTEHGEVRVGAREESAGQVTFYVSDTGIG